MPKNERIITILIADDNADDSRLVEQAFRENGQRHTLVFVRDGIELTQYLRRQGGYTNPTDSHRPALILLELDLPKKDGYQALAEIKADADLRSIPVVVLTRFSTNEEILRSYQLGAAGFIIKPTELKDMSEVVKVLNQYWFEVVELSPGEIVKTKR